MTPADTAIRVGLARALLEPCLLCGGHADGAAIFIPDDPTAWGANPGRTRMLFYALCGPCGTRPPEEAEDALVRAGLGPTRAD